MLVLAAVLARVLPVSSPPSSEHYGALLAAPVRLMKAEPDLRRSCAYQALLWRPPRTGSAVPEPPAAALEPVGEPGGLGPGEAAGQSSVKPLVIPMSRKPVRLPGHPHRHRGIAADAIHRAGEVESLLHGPDLLVLARRVDPGRVADRDPADRHGTAGPRGRC